MAITANTNVNSTIPDVVDYELLLARYANAVALNRVMNKTGLVNDKGDQLTVSTQDSLTGGTHSSDGSFTPETLDPDGQVITISTWNYVAFEITDRAVKQSGADLIRSYSGAIAKREGEFIDTDILAEYANILPANTVGSTETPSPFDEDLALPAMLFLADLNIPKSSLSWFLPPIAFLDGLYKKDRWTAANMTGLGKSVLTNGFEFPILGAPAYQSTLVATVGSVRKGILAHREWVGAAVQINGKRRTYEGLSNNKAVTGVHSQILYGVKTIRSNHAVTVNIKAAKSTL